MTSIAGAIRRHPLLSFSLIAYATFYFAGVMMELFPSDAWYLFVYGSFLGGLIVSSVEGGKAGRKEWLSRITRWRFGPQWYAVAIGLPIALGAIVLGANLALGAPTPSVDLLNAWPNILPAFAFMLFFVTLGEEPGFRGFALPKLLVGRSAVAAGLLIGLLHAGWHIPLFISGETPILTLPLFFAVGILTTWMVVNTKGSVILPMLFHATHNAFFAYTRDMFEGRYVAQEQILLTIAMCLAAAVVVYVFGPSLKAGGRVRRATTVVAEPVLA